MCIYYCRGDVWNFFFDRMFVDCFLLSWILKIVFFCVLIWFGDENDIVYV